MTTNKPTANHRSTLKPLDDAELTTVAGGGTAKGASTGGAPRKYLEIKLTEVLISG